MKLFVKLFLQQKIYELLDNDGAIGADKSFQCFSHDGNFDSKIMVCPKYTNPTPLIVSRHLLSCTATT